MSILVSPTERGLFATLGRTSALPERNGVDAYWVARGKQWGVQRKRFPEDFVASLHDGRLSKELGQMGKLDAAIILIEGYGKWTVTGELVDAPLSRSQLWGFIMSCFLTRGVLCIQVADESEGIELVKSLYKWSNKEAHRSLLSRPGPKKDAWGTRNSKDWQIHLMQSFEGIGPGVAEAIIDHFGGVPLEWTVSVNELQQVKGVGAKRAQSLIGVLGNRNDRKKLQA